MSKLTLKEKLGYSAGEIGSTISWQGMMFFLGFFYTDIFGLPAITAGYLLFLPRFFDAFVDPIVGVIADRTNTRWGKFRPYILWFFIPYSILMVLMYVTPDFSLTGKTIYAYVTYILMMVIYSLIMTPYNALGGVITNDHIDRTSLQSYRFLMAFVGGLLIRGLTTPLANLFGGGYNPANDMPMNPQKGFMLTMLVFAIISLAAFYFTFASTKERVAPPPKQRTPLLTDLKDLINNRPWIILFFVSTLNLIYVGAWSASMAYFFKYYMSVKTLQVFGIQTGYDLFSAFNVFGSIVIILILAFPVSNWLAKHLGKRNTLVICFTLVAASIAGFYLCRPTDAGLTLFFQFIQSAAAAPTMPLVWSMYADAADYSEWKNNRRATGLVFSAVVMGQKAGIALGSAITLWVLGRAGYNQEVMQQTDSALTAIRYSMSLIPGAIALVTAILCIFYPLSNAKMDEIQAALSLRRQKETETTM